MQKKIAHTPGVFMVSHLGSPQTFQPKIPAEDCGKLPSLCRAACLPFPFPHIFPQHTVPRPAQPRVQFGDWFELPFEGGQGLQPWFFLGTPRGGALDRHPKHKATPPGLVKRSLAAAAERAPRGQQRQGPGHGDGAGGHHGDHLRGVQLIACNATVGFLSH